MFDPNNPTDKTGSKKRSYSYDWATYVPNRYPQFKVHGNKGQATAAIKWRFRYEDNYRFKYLGSWKGESPQLYRLDAPSGKWINVPLKKRFDTDASPPESIIEGE
jgi:hypothetical protein